MSRYLIAFLLMSIVAEYFLRDMMCGTMVFMLGCVSVVSLSNDIARRKQNQQAWTNHIQRSQKPAFQADPWVEPGMKTGMQLPGEEIRMQVVDTIPDWLKTPSMRDEWAKQDLLGAVASYYAQRGGVTDELVRSSIKDIEAMPSKYRYDALEVLETMVINGHVSGRIHPPVMDEIQQATSRSLGYGCEVTHKDKGGD